MREFQTPKRRVKNKLNKYTTDTKTREYLIDLSNSRNHTLTYEFYNQRNKKESIFFPGS